MVQSDQKMIFFENIFKHMFSEKMLTSIIYNHSKSYRKFFLRSGMGREVCWHWLSDYNSIVRSLTFSRPVLHGNQRADMGQCLFLQLKLQTQIYTLHNLYSVGKEEGDLDVVLTSIINQITTSYNNQLKELIEGKGHSSEVIQP